MFQQLGKILGMIRFGHTVFALPFALLAATMAWTTPAMSAGTVQGGPNLTVGFRWRELAGILVCMICARSAAMAMNRLVDRRIDAANPRTRSRHLVTGVLSVGSVAVFTALASVGFVAGTLLFLPNRLPLYFSVPVLLFLFAYSFTKRFTVLAHFWLGAALMLAPVSAWIAIRGELLGADPLDILPAVVLGMAVMLWVAGFDIIYACQDVEFDRAWRLHSLPAWVGVVAALRLAAVCHLGMVVLLAALVWVCPQLNLGWVYLSGVGAVAVLLVYEHALVRPNDLTRVNVAFFHVNSIISIGLLLVGTWDLLT
jgi:4-hydroxybenzoate polyprenyltransferase